MARIPSGALSWNAWLSEISPGETRYVETTLKAYPADMRNLNTPLSRRPASMADMRFATSLFTAVSAGNAGDVRYILAVERTA